MSDGTPSVVEVVPGWWLTFMTKVQQNLPRPGQGFGQISKDVADGWAKNGEALKKALAEVLLPPAAPGFILKLADPPEVAKFFAENGISIWKGLASGDGLEGEEDCVPEPDDEVNFGNAVLETHLKGDETGITGEEKMMRARAIKNRQLAGRAFLALLKDWQEKKSAGKPWDSLLEKLYRVRKIGNVIYFFGLALRDSGGNRCALYLCRNDHGSWNWDCYWLGYRWLADYPSLSLASID